MIHRSPSLLSVILVLLHLALVMSTFKSSLHPVKWDVDTAFPGEATGSIKADSGEHSGGLFHAPTSGLTVRGGCSSLVQ
ncbi:hypothetical protein HanXRQr2_Chr11g0496141 [Helianthus annuus]|uniref:Uncharacterized protein n=1 Tax=Helianthus annuus TaxID=4232 RepID=A0A9K3HQG8_HELAN|nr:hypothetical protein HanXRQr2_Chr11g0496141 [Helianthus annuus]KAJ0875590.1 hypothetical protein HanPSC8_Chr11g0478191 [Helianthus annuus]